MKYRQPIRACSMFEAVASCAAVGLVITLTLPMLDGVRSFSQVEESMNNLITIGFAHAAYAADWEGRQVTYAVDDISTYGPNMVQALAFYEFEHGEPHPPVIGGWGVLPTSDDPGLLGYWLTGGTAGNYAWSIQPIIFNEGFEFGSFRLWSLRPWHDYVNGRCSDPTFFAPADSVQYPIVEPFFDSLWEQDGEINDQRGWSTYVLSPAAYFSPYVMRSPARGGYQSPFAIPNGFTTPGLYDARYPDLKTQMLEHLWLQNQPNDPCNPAFPYGAFDGCEPWHFNHGLDSAPATLFYDMSVRLLPNAEAIAADQKVMKQTGAGLWNRDTPFGESGYLGDDSYDGTITSHHILTTEGIHGRDTIAK